MPGRIFVNYRRGDDPGFTQALYMRLEAEFTADDVFMDVEGHIKPGDDFVDVINAQVAVADAVVVVIGPRWTELLAARTGARDDFVVVEIQAALKKNKRVIPVLVGGATMPSADQLPKSIQPLARRHAVGLRPERFKGDCQGLVTALAEHLAALEVERAARSNVERAAAKVEQEGRGAEEAARIAAAEERAQSRSVAGLSSAVLRRAEALKPGETFNDGDNCPEMVVVPEGAFSMGSNDAGDEKPPHRVTVRQPFAVGKFSVTFDEWDACAEAGGCSRYRPDDLGWGRGRRPVINVSWDDAKAYVAWLSAKTGQAFRLLSEAEWEYAARAGSETKYPWGDVIGKGNANCRDSSNQWGGKQTAPVGSFPPNLWGLYDMHGNVWEWVEDPYHDTYAGAPVDGSVWTSGRSYSRVLRGGSWYALADALRSANRSFGSPDYRNNAVGFRVARTL